MLKVSVEKVIKFGAKNPEKLFLADGLGAILSAVLLGVVLVKLEPLFGIPRRTLYFLALFPCLFALYDFYFAIRTPRNIVVYLKGIAMMNGFYCLLSLGVSIYHFQELTILGWIYIGLEIAIVMTLASLEFKVAQAVGRI